MVVAMMAVVQAGETADVGGRLIQGDRSFLVAGYSCDVVIEVGKGLVTQVKHSVCDISLGEHSSLFQVAVHDVPIWLFGGDDARLEVKGERHAPE